MECDGTKSSNKLEQELASNLIIQMVFLGRNWTEVANKMTHYALSLGWVARGGSVFWSHLKAVSPTN